MWNLRENTFKKWLRKDRKMSKKKYSKIENGRPKTVHDYRLADELREYEFDSSVQWIKENIEPMNSPNLSQSSYYLKHILEHSTGIYLTNNQFKDLMLKCGFAPINEGFLNWNYKIKKVKEEKPKKK